MNDDDKFLLYLLFGMIGLFGFMATCAFITILKLEGC
jgi:hypothetical protein